MGNKGFSRTGMGMFFQAFGMFFIIGGLVVGEYAQIVVGLIFFLPGLVIYWTEQSSLLTYARDWVYTLYIFCLLMDAVSFMVLITGDESFLPAIGGLLICVLITVGMSKFCLFMNRKCDKGRTTSVNMVQHLQSRVKSKPAAVDSKATTPRAVQKEVIPQPSGDLSQKRVEEMAKILSEQIQPSVSDQKQKTASSMQPVVSDDLPKEKLPQTTQQKAQPAASGLNPKTTVSMQSAVPADPPKAAIPQTSQDKTQQRIKAIAEKLQAQLVASSEACAALQAAEELEELYRAIDEQAALLAPDEQTCYTAQGQQALLDAAMRALPQLTMLNAPGFPGDRIRHAGTGAEAYQAMLDLANSMRQLVQEMDRNQIEAVLVGISQEDALMAWKAFRFYTDYVGDRGFTLLLEQLAWVALG